MSFEPTWTRVVEPGASHRLGAHFDGEGVNFALFSAHAERVELCLFNADGQETARVDLPEYTNEIWHGYLPGLAPGARYGYRVHGKFDPEAGHRFNPNKLLIDPYARFIEGEIAWGQATYGYKFDDPDEDLSFDETDSAAAMPKCVVIDPKTSGGHPNLKACHPVEPRDLLRDPCAGLYQAASGRARSAARHIRRPRDRRHREIYQEPRHHIR